MDTQVRALALKLSRSPSPEIPLYVTLLKCSRCTLHSVVQHRAAARHSLTDNRRSDANTVAENRQADSAISLAGSAVS
jgi:hypothetical protein